MKMSEMEKYKTMNTIAEAMEHLNRSTKGCMEHNKADLLCGLRDARHVIQDLEKHLWKNTASIPSGEDVAEAELKALGMDVVTHEDMADESVDEYAERYKRAHGLEPELPDTMSHPRYYRRAAFDKCEKCGTLVAPGVEHKCGEED